MWTVILLIGTSWTFNSEQQIVEMECRLLFSKFNNEAMISRVQEKISGLPGKHLAHCADALKLWLRTTLDLKKPVPQAEKIEGVTLRCYSGSCPGSREDIPYSLVRTREACPQCNSFVMICSGCRHMRRNLVSDRCESCKKVFL